MRGRRDSEEGGVVGVWEKELAHSLHPFAFSFGIRLTKLFVARSDWFLKGPSKEIWMTLNQRFSLSELQNCCTKTAKESFDFNATS